MRSIRRPRWVLLATLAGLMLAIAPPIGAAHAASVTLMVSSSSNRSSAVGLNGTTQSGVRYIFTTPDTGVTSVSFWLDDPNRTGAPIHVESWAPFNFAGDTASGANPWDSSKVANGSHVITAAVVSGTSTTVTSATFQISNGIQPPPPAPYTLELSSHPDRSAPVPVSGDTVSGTVYVFVPATAAITRVSFYLDDIARAKAPYHVENSGPWDLGGTGVGQVADPWSSASIPDGAHILSADIATTSGVFHVDAPFTVSNGGAPVVAGTNFTFAPIAPLPIGTTEGESVVVNDLLYLFGGFDVSQECCTPTTRAWVYNPATNVWAALPAMPAMGISHAGIDTDGTRYIYYAGGYAYDPAGIQDVNATALGWRYDIVTGTYTALPNLPIARTAGGMAYIGGALYYFGGNGLDRNVDSGDVWMLDVAHGATAWVARASMPNPRDHIGWAVIGGEIYATGGQYSTNANLAQAELDRYDPATDTWTTLAPEPVARSHDMDSTFVLNGQLVVAGGWTSTAVTGSVTEYNPATNTWRSLTNLPESRTSATVKSISGGRYVFCCGSASSSTATGWMATPVS